MVAQVKLSRCADNKLNFYNLFYINKVNLNADAKWGELVFDRFSEMPKNAKIF